MTYYVYVITDSENHFSRVGELALLSKDELDKEPKSGMYYFECRTVYSTADKQLLKPSQVEFLSTL
jgi:hypothetical protein